MKGTKYFWIIWGLHFSILATGVLQNWVEMYNRGTYGGYKSGYKSDYKSGYKSSRHYGEYGVSRLFSYKTINIFMQML